MKSDPKAVKTAWVVWAVFVAGYVAMNVYALKSSAFPKEKIIPGFALAMPIICNLAWWAVGFRLRFRINHWWAFGFLTTVVVVIAGILTMVSVAQGTQYPAGG